MCSNYQPVIRLDRLLTFFGVERDRDEPPADVFPTGLAPFVRLAEDGSGNRVVQDGAFGLVPPGEYDTWLTCSVAEAPAFLRQWTGELIAEPGPLIRAPRAISGRVVRPSMPPDPDPETGELFR